MAEPPRSPSAAAKLDEQQPPEGFRVVVQIRVPMLDVSRSFVINLEGGIGERCHHVEQVNRVIDDMERKMCDELSAKAVPRAATPPVQERKTTQSTCSYNGGGEAVPREATPPVQERKTTKSTCSYNGGGEDQGAHTCSDIEDEEDDPSSFMGAEGNFSAQPRTTSLAAMSTQSFTPFSSEGSVAAASTPASGSMTTARAWGKIRGVMDICKAHGIPYQEAVNTKVITRVFDAKIPTEDRFAAQDICKANGIPCQEAVNTKVSTRVFDAKIPAEERPNGARPRMTRRKTRKDFNSNSSVNSFSEDQEDDSLLHVSGKNQKKQQRPEQLPQIPDAHPLGVASVGDTAGEQVQQLADDHKDDPHQFPQHWRRVASASPEEHRDEDQSSESRMYSKSKSVHFPSLDGMSAPLTARGSKDSSPRTSVAARWTSRAKSIITPRGGPGPELSSPVSAAAATAAASSQPPKGASVKRTSIKASSGPGASRGANRAKTSGVVPVDTEEAPERLSGRSSEVVPVSPSTPSRDFGSIFPKF